MKIFKLIILLLAVIMLQSCKKDIPPEDRKCDNPIIYFDQLTIDYSSPKTVYVSGMNCDICQFGGDGILWCNCIAEDCENLYFQAMADCEGAPEYGECETQWGIDEAWGDNDGSLEETCCPEAKYILESCLKQCGHPDPIRNPLGYTYLIELWYSSEELQIPPNSPPDEAYQAGEIEGEPGPFSYEITTDLNNPSIQSFCVKTTMVVLYDDGTCCMFRDRLCTTL